MKTSIDTCKLSDLITGLFISTGITPAKQSLQY